MKRQNDYGVIYCILNIINGKMYIGSAKNPNRRKNEHFNELKKNKHSNQKLQAAHNKYGPESFIFEILTHEPIHTLLDRENEFLAKLEPFYNIAKIASAPMTGRKHSPETILKFKANSNRGGKGRKRAPWTEVARENQIKARTGLKRNEEFKQRRRKEALEDGRAKYLKESNEKAKKPIKDSLGNQFPSMIECSKFHEMSVQAVCDILKGRTKKTKKGVIFTYV